MTSLERLQAWCVSQCDGDWEHSYGIKIGTLDNPGWTVSIDLNGAKLEGCVFERVFVERSKDDWLSIVRNEMKFKIACGPQNLEESLAIFCDWAEHSREGE